MVTKRGQWPLCVPPFWRALQKGCKIHPVQELLSAGAGGASLLSNLHAQDGQDSIYLRLVSFLAPDIGSLSFGSESMFSRSLLIAGDQNYFCLADNTIHASSVIAGTSMGP